MRAHQPHQTSSGGQRLEPAYTRLLRTGA